MIHRESIAITFQTEDGEVIHDFEFWTISPIVVHKLGEIVELHVDIKERTGKSNVSPGEWEQIKETKQYYEIVDVLPVSYWDTQDTTSQRSVSLTYIVEEIEYPL